MLNVNEWMFKNNLTTTGAVIHFCGWCWRFETNFNWTSVNTTRQAQKSLDDRWETQKIALHKTPAPWSAKSGDGNVSGAREVCSGKVFAGAALAAQLLSDRDDLVVCCPRRYLDAFWASGYCASARAHVMLHERQIIRFSWIPGK